MRVSSKEYIYVMVVLIIGLLISTGGLTVLYLNLNTEYQTLQSKFAEVSSEVDSLKTAIDRMRPASNGSEVHYGLAPEQIYNLVEPSVVKIVVKAKQTSGLVPYGQGSGFIYSKDGFIVTNYHVVVGADAIEVTFLDGDVVKTELVGADPYSDLAVIKLDPGLKILQPLSVGNSSGLRVGDPVLAVGNPFGLSGSMTEGIVSQLDRTLNTQYGYLIVGIIQTDAAINPGNSGGPLLNMWGEVVGVNTAIASRSGEFSGVGLAIPSNLMVRVVSSLIREGRYSHPWLGLAGVDLTPAIAEAMGLNISKGFLVTYVAPQSPAGKAGLRAGDKSVVIDGQRINVGGDIITGVDDVKVRNLEDLLLYIEYNRKPGEVVNLTIIRYNEVKLLAVELEERPPPGRLFQGIP